MTDINQMREAFEVWAAPRLGVDKSWLETSRTEEDEDDGFPYRPLNDEGEQSDEINQLVGCMYIGWRHAWQASRQAVVVELPFLYPVYRQEVKSAIEAHGLRCEVKS